MSIVLSWGLIYQNWAILGLTERSNNLVPKNFLIFFPRKGTAQQKIALYEGEKGFSKNSPF